MSHGIVCRTVGEKVHIMRHIDLALAGHDDNTFVVFEDGP